jgi:spermidine synthase
LSALALVVALPGTAPWVKLRWAAGGALVAVLCVTAVASQTDGLQVPRTLLMKRLKRHYRENLFYREDINGIVSVWINPLEEDPWINDKRLYIDGQPMASAYRYGMIYERLQAHYPLLLHPDPQDVLVICLGTGTTLGSVGRYPVSHMDCVELSHSVVAAGVCFEEETHGILDDPRLTMHVGDGRNYLLSTSRSYDVITAEPMHPHLAGTVNLYTREYFGLVRDRLRPGGICSHWIPVHKMRPREVKSAVAAFREVFPHTMLFLETADVIVIGSGEPLTIDAARWRELLGDERTGADLEEVGLSTLPQLLATYMMDTPRIDRYVSGVPAVTDDLPTLEFFGSHTAATRQRPGNIRQIIEHRGELGDVLAHMSGELTPHEAEELEKLYPLEASYLSAYAEYAAENYAAAASGFADVLRQAPDDRRAEISLRAVEQTLRGQTGAAREAPLSSSRQ